MGGPLPARSSTLCRRARCLFVAALLVASTALAKDVSLLDAGQQTKKKVDPRGWVALWPDAFTAVKVKVQKATSPVEGVAAIDVVVVDAKRPPLVLVKGLEPRAVRPLTEGPQPALYEVDKPIRGEGFTLTTERVGERHRLVLREGERTQTLYESDGDLDGWAFHWAGDLDGDGRPDFLLSADAHYNVSTKRLFLSSRAGPGQLVKEVATLRETGC